MKKDRRKNKRFVVAAIVLLLLVAITIGYAGLSTTLYINGNTSISKVNWDIHFENVREIKGSVTATSPAVISGEKSTIVNYAVNLVNPGDYYAFYVDVVNAGTLDAVITDVIKQGLTVGNKDYSEFLSYDVTYAENNFDPTKGNISLGSEIKRGQGLNAKQRDTYKVIVKFKDDDPTALPEDGVPSLNLTFAVTYSQK